MSGITQAQVELVQAGWHSIEPQGDVFVERFYKNLFEINPDLQALFKRSMKMQGRKLMSMLSTAVESINSIEKVFPALSGAGQRHSQYGVKVEHYPQVTEAWIQAVSQLMGDQFNQEQREAWRAVLDFVGMIMQTNTRLANDASVGRVEGPLA